MPTDVEKLLQQIRSLPTDDQRRVRAALPENVLDDVPAIDPANCREATRAFFSKCFDASPESADSSYDALLRLSTPEDVLAVALEEYEQRGYEGRLTLAAALLGDMGAKSLPVLRKLAESGRAECEYFVPVLAALPGVSPGERLQVLGIMARNPDADVRWRVAEALDQFDSALAGEVCKILGAPEEDQGRTL